MKTAPHIDKVITAFFRLLTKSEKFSLADPVETTFLVNEAIKIRQAKAEFFKEYNKLTEEQRLQFAMTILSQFEEYAGVKNE